MNQARTLDVKQLEDGKRGAIPRLTDGKTSPTRLLNAGEKAMLKAAEADAALRKSCPPPAAQKPATPKQEENKSEESGWALVIGHAF